MWRGLLGHGRPPLGPPHHRAGPQRAPRSPAGPGRAYRIGVPGGLSRATPQRGSGDLLRQGGYDELVATNGSFMESVTENEDTRQRQHREQAGPGCHGKPVNVACRLLQANVLGRERQWGIIPPFVSTSDALESGQVGSDSLGGSNGQWTFWKQSGQSSPGHEDVPDF